MNELQVAHERYQDSTHQMATTGDWNGYADLFTEDAVVRRVGRPDCVGREAIRRCFVEEATQLPGSLVERTDVVWRSYDLELMRVVQELRHVARDPGDGSEHAALATSMLRYGGDGLWSGLEVVHSPHAYRAMFRSWARVASLHGHPDADAVMLHLGGAPGRV